MRYRLCVLAPSTVDVIRYAGGWLCDRVLAGWEVTVLVSDSEDVRPLRILGADAFDLVTALSARVGSPVPQAVAVAGELLESDARVREGLFEVLGRGRTEITLWGNCPAAIDSQLRVVRHEVSNAARTFKVQALRAAAQSADLADTSELFRSTLRSSVRPCDLVPAV
ncbi:hypothetical protein ACQPZ2_22830 [Nocardia pseudovaccinii]|uniref:hypothetical protein n=1 Tax=Nocardia pseudovaccinii TaxID=189540 RepID=UPI003D8E0D28